MSKFIINCPVCKKQIQVSTGIFAKKNIKCDCGYDINVEANRLDTKICAHCGASVTYDKANEKNVVCHNCHNKLFSKETIKITCPTCHKDLVASSEATQYVCPQCNEIINVQARYAQEKSAGQISTIKWDMGKNNIFIYRHPIESFNMGSQLIVAEGQKAIFFCDGQGLDIFGPGRHTLQTQKLPLMDSVYKLSLNSNQVFDSRIYFIRTNRLKINWGVSKITLIDNKFGFHIDMGCSGSFETQIIDDDESPRKLLYMIMNSSNSSSDPNILGNVESYSSDYIAEKFKDYITTNIQDLLSNILVENSINILDVDLKKNIIEDLLRQRLNERILVEYGMFIPKSFFAMPYIKIHNQDEVNMWRKQEADMVLKVRSEEVLKVEAEAAQSRKFVEERTEAGISVIRAQGEAEKVKILASSEAEKIKMVGSAEASVYAAQAAAEAEEMRLKNFTYQQETVRIIGSEAMKKGLPGTGNNTGGSSGIIGDLVGLGVSIGATKEILEMVKNENELYSNRQTQMMQNGVNQAWNCGCGTNGINSNYCPNCGKPKNNVWSCSKCGTSRITSNYCPNCGEKRGGVS